MLQKIRYRIVFNRARRLNKRGEGLLQVECQQGGRRIYFSTHIYCSPEHYAHGSVTGTDNAEALNYALYETVSRIERVELEYIRRGVDVTLPLLKEAVRAHISPAAKLMDFGNEVISQSERKELTKLNYGTLLRNIEKFRKGTLVTDVDYNFITAYDRWMRDGGMSHNTRVSRMHLLRALMNEARKRDLIALNPFDRFRIPSMTSKKGYLTAEQLRHMERLKPEGRQLVVRDCFLIGCYTGLRFSDVKTLRQEHYADGWIKKKMVKTGNTVELPVAVLFDGKFLIIMERHGGDIGTLTRQLGDNGTVNKTLRPMLDVVGAAKTITFHSSRHTFATQLGERGIPLETIQQLLGHTKITTTQIYRESSRTGLLNSLRRRKGKREKR